MGIPTIAPLHGLGSSKVATNLVPNGGFETNTTGWTAGGNYGIARSTDFVLFGSQSLKCTATALSASENQAAATPSLTLTAVQHVFSVFVYIPTAWAGGNINVDTNNFTLSPVPAVGTDVAANMSLRDAWQRIVYPFLPDAGDVIGNFRLTSSSCAAGGIFYIDGAQLEVGSAATPYIETDGGVASRKLSKWVG